MKTSFHSHSGKYDTAHELHASIAKEIRIFNPPIVPKFIPPGFKNLVFRCTKKICASNPSYLDEIRTLQITTISRYDMVKKSSWPKSS